MSHKHGKADQYGVGRLARLDSGQPVVYAPVRIDRDGQQAPREAILS